MLPTQSLRGGARQGSAEIHTHMDIPRLPVGSLFLRLMPPGGMGIRTHESIDIWALVPLPQAMDPKHDARWGVTVFGVLCVWR